MIIIDDLGTTGWSSQVAKDTFDKLIASGYSDGEAITTTQIMTGETYIGPAPDWNWEDSPLLKKRKQLEYYHHRRRF